MIKYLNNISCSSFTSSSSYTIL